MKEIQPGLWRDEGTQFFIRIGRTEADGRTEYRAHVFDLSRGEDSRLLAITPPQDSEHDAFEYGGYIIQACKGELDIETGGLDEAQAMVMALINNKGFVNKRENLWQLFALLHTEVSEATQAFKRGEGDDKIREELTDALIRLLHLMGVVGGEAQSEFDLKMQANWNRPYKYNLAPEHEG